MTRISLLIEQLARMVETLYEDSLSESILQRGQYAYILYLMEHEGSNQYDISRDLLIDKTTVAKALKKLEQSGIIMRRTDAHDKRKVNVYLTAKGKLLHQKVVEVANRVEGFIAENVHRSHVESFKKQLTLFNDELDMRWCDIKNYKRTSEYSLASQEDYRKLEERMNYYVPDSDELFVERHEKYVLNWIRFTINEHFDSAVVSEISFHGISDPIIDGMSLIKNFEEWHHSNHAGRIHIKVREGNTALQKLLHKNNYYFKYYDKIAGQNVYTYEKGLH